MKPGAPRPPAPRAGVKSDFGIGGHQRIVGKPRVQGGVRYDKQIRLLDRVGAKGDVAGSLRYIQADSRLEPLPLFVHQGDQGNRGFANAGSQLGQFVKQFLGHSVKHFVLPEHFEALLFLSGICSVHGL